MRSFAFAFAAGSLVGLMLSLASCGGPKPSCAGCSGCCDATGQCQPGSSNLACGNTGTSCTTCTAGQTCSLGACLNIGGQGGGGSSTGGGSGVGGGSSVGGGSAVGGGGATGSVQGACDTIIQEQCAFLARCGFATSPAACIDYYVKLLGSLGFCTEYVAAGRDGRLDINATALSTCVSVLRSASCMTQLSGAPDPSCNLIFRGLVPQGMSCYDDTECVAGSYCDSTTMVCPGTCLAKKPLNTVVSSSSECLSSYAYNGVCANRVARNGNCGPVAPSTFTQLCVEGTFCSSTNVCSDPLPLGSPCTSGSGCQSPGICRANVCRAYQNLGDACANTSTGGECKIGLFCDAFGSATGQCRAIGALGQPCTVTATCEQNLICRDAGTTTFGSCAPGVGLNGACQTIADCASDTYCGRADGGFGGPGTCLAEKPIGGSCTTSAECIGFASCTNSRCTPYSCQDPTP